MRLLRAAGKLAADDQAGVQDASIFPLWRPNVSLGPRLWQLTAVSNQARCEQDFPYNMETGIEHHNIWSPVPLSSQELQQVGSCR